ncbi:MAG: YkgJ family cysteine cluster protein [Spirochaetales bacterium]
MFNVAHRRGLRFECAQCSFCCTGSPGRVWLSHVDIEGLCAFLGLAFEDFAERFCVFVEVEGGRALSLIEKKGYDCVFLENGKCSVYRARPIQCRTYPFWEEILKSEKSWNEEAAYCPGIGKGAIVPPERIIESLILARTNTRRLFPETEENIKV